MSSPRADEDTAMDTHDLKLSIPETNADARSSGDSPESGVSTPRYSEHQSGSKRLRTGSDGWEEDSGGPHPDDEPGTSAGLLVVTPAEARQLTTRTKAACSELADVIVRLTRESTWTETKEADAKRKKELCDQLRGIQRRLDRAEPSPELEQLRAYIAFAIEKARPATRVTDLLDDELELILGKVALSLKSPKQLMALSTLSRRFRKLVRQPAVWRDLDLSQHRQYMTDSLLLRQIVRNDGAFSNLRRANFNGCTRVTDTAIRRVLSISGKTLTHLSLEGCALVTTELVRYASTACPNLQVLDLTECANVDTVQVLRLADEEWPRLRELHLMDTKALSGRVPQVEFEELQRALTERKQRYVQELKDEEERKERLNADALAFGMGTNVLWTAPAPSGIANMSWQQVPGVNLTDPDDPSQQQMHHVACRCGPPLILDDLCEFVESCTSHLQQWTSGLQVAACDHAMVAQGTMQEHNYALNMLPDCGHVICVECEQKSRVNMTRPHGQEHYVYPCPVCAQDMPDPGGFTITLGEQIAVTE